MHLGIHQPRTRMSESLGAIAAFVMAVLLAVVSLGIAPATAQTPAPSCAPLAAGTPAASPAAPIEVPPVTVPENATRLKVGYMPLSIYAPIYVAHAKGYYAEQGLDVELQSFTNGTDMTVLTSTNDLQIGLTGVGPAFWNAIDQGLPLKIIAPGHAEGSPVASPLMISKKACEAGTITSVADLEGKRVSVNAPGATEFWLDAALRTGGLTIEDVDLQYLTFPDAVTALDSGALDAAIVGEPIATQAEQQGLAVRLLADFPVQHIQPTMVFGNEKWLQDNPEAATAFVAGYLHASRDLMENPNDPQNLAIINQYTGVPAELVAESVKPVYAEDGTIDIDSLNLLQTFFGDRDLLDYDEPIDPATIVDTQYVDAALKLLDGE
ncbi:MAG TPA: ABC transporter substrate-binding protein [Thermomicrobiales bacterium]|nr:ABC transporter substrate-binding protein [Thermomicrobiales bacterium]